MSIFDELATEYGLTLDTPPPRRPPPPPRRHPGPTPAPPGGWRPDLDATQQIPRVAAAAARRPPTVCPTCADRDRPWVLMHRHLDHLTHRITELEIHMSAAFENLSAQVTNAEQVTAQSLIPALQQFGQLVAQSAQVPGGPSEEELQALADRLSTMVSQQAAALQQAQAQIPPAA